MPADLDAEVKDEVRRVKERVEPRRSLPLLGGATVDYQAARSDAASADAERLADALVWLERAPLVLFGAEAGPGPGMSTQVARDATRAALLLAHVKDARVDAASAAAWARLENIDGSSWPQRTTGRRRTSRRWPRCGGSTSLRWRTSTT